MSLADNVTKKYMQDNAHFADLFNYYIYDGKAVINPDDLIDKDPTELCILSNVFIRVCKTDTVTPVVTITLYWGTKSWDAATRLSDMFPADTPEEISAKITVPDGERTVDMCVATKAFFIDEEVLIASAIKTSYAFYYAVFAAIFSPSVIFIMKYGNITSPNMTSIAPRRKLPQWLPNIKTTVAFETYSCHEKYIPRPTDVSGASIGEDVGIL